MITDTISPRFLIIQTAFIGDVILATALLEQLHQTLPGARIDVLVRKGNEGLLANHPFLNEVLIWDKERKYRSLWALLKVIRDRRYDTVLNLQRYGTTGLLTALSKAEMTVGFDKNPFSRLFTHTVPHRFEPGFHEVDRNAQLLSRLPAPFRTVALRTLRTKPKLYPSHADYQTVRPFQKGPYVCMVPTSVWFTKQYPAERWIDLIQLLPQHVTIYLLGAPGDAPIGETIRNRTGDNVVNLAGTLTLLQSAALLEGAVMNYMNDSAPLHLCSAMNAPTTAVFCSTVPEFGFGPLADGSAVIQTPEPLDCKPCGIHGHSACPLGHFRCAWTISVPDLAERTRSLIE